MVGITAYGAYVPMLRLPLAAHRRRDAQAGRPREGGRQLGRGRRHDGRRRGHRLPPRHRPRRRSTRSSSRRRRTPSRRSRARRSSRRRSTSGATSTRSDVGDTLRAGTNALRAAVDAVKAGSARRVLVVASDVRMAAPRTGLEANLGDGAAAFLLGADDVAVAVDAVHAVSDEIVDVWRTEGDPFVHAWEDRFVVDHGYRASVREVVRGLLEKTGLERRRTFARLVLYGPDARAHAHGGARPRLRPEDAGAGPALRQGRQRRRRAGAAAPRGGDRGGEGGPAPPARRLRRRRRRARAVHHAAGRAPRGPSRRRAGTWPAAPSWGATTSTSASASSSPPSTTAAPARASRPPSTSATATPT